MGYRLERTGARLDVEPRRKKALQRGHGGVYLREYPIFEWRSLKMMITYNCLYYGPRGKSLVENVLCNAESVALI